MLLRHLPMLVLLGLASGVLIFLIVERARHQRNLDKIPIKVMINGSRGKSSVTRLTRAALAADRNENVVGKTTGSAARFIYPGGREAPIIRKNAIINVIEQIYVIARAVAVKASTVVVECMAVDPDLQELNQKALIQSSIGVITNVRPDHLDEMGGPDRTVEQVARSLCRGMPVGGVCVTAERDYWNILAEEAERRGTQLHYADPDAVTDAEMLHFTWITFKENVAIALTVAALRGVPRADALRAMYAAAPDPGVLRVDACQHNGVRFNAVNLAAANDPQSTLQNLDLLRDRGLIPAGISLVINCRPDRVERNGQMGGIADQAGAEHIFLIGSPVKSAADHIAPHLQGRVVALEGDEYTGADILEAIAARMPGDPRHAVVLVGNIHGRGQDLLHAIAGAAYTGPDVDDELAAMLDDTAVLQMPALDETRIEQTRRWDDGATVIIPVLDPAAETRRMYLN
jgi:gamma-polyglutamate synthase